MVSSMKGLTRIAVPLLASIGGLAGCGKSVELAPTKNSAPTPFCEVARGGLTNTLPAGEPPPKEDVVIAKVRETVEKLKAAISGIFGKNEPWEHDDNTLQWAHFDIARARANFGDLLYELEKGLLIDDEPSQVLQLCRNSNEVINSLGGQNVDSLRDMSAKLRSCSGSLIDGIRMGQVIEKAEKERV